MTHDEPCFSLFTDNRQNLLRRALCACSIWRSPRRFRRLFHDRWSWESTLSIAFRMDAASGLSSFTPAPSSSTRVQTPPCSGVCRKHDQRHAEIQGFAGAVHAAMGEKHVGDLQHGDLIHMRVDFDVAGSVPSAAGFTCSPMERMTRQGPSASAATHCW